MKTPGLFRISYMWHNKEQQPKIVAMKKFPAGEQCRTIAQRISISGSFQDPLRQSHDWPDLVLARLRLWARASGRWDQLPEAPSN